MLKNATFILVFGLISTTGCWYGTFMSPRAIGTGKIRVRIIGDFPAYVSVHDRDKDRAKVPGPGGKEVTPGFGDAVVKGMVTYGAGPRFDVGVQANMYSVGIHAKGGRTSSPSIGARVWTSRLSSSSIISSRRSASRRSSRSSAAGP